MHLEAEVPRVVAHHQAGHLLVGQGRDAIAVLAVGLARLLGDDILPTVEEIGTARAVGDDQVGLVRLHRLELLVRVRLGIAPVGLHEILAEAEAAAVTALGVVDHLAAPGLDHADQDMRILGATEALRRKHLRIMAPDVLDHLQGLARLDVDQRELHLLGDVESELIDEVAGMGEILRLGELLLARVPEVLADLGLQLGILMPGLQRLGVASKRGDAGADVVLVAALVHQRELARDDGHGRLLRYRVAVIGDAATGGMVGVLVEILAQLVSRDVKKRHLRTRPKRLTDATPHVEIMVVGDVFLVVRPNLLFSFDYHVGFKDLKIQRFKDWLLAFSR